MNFFVNKNQITEDEIYIENSDVNHIKNVLRKQKGDIISVVCDKIVYKTEITNIDNEYVHCKILEKIEQKVSNTPRITIFQGLAKADKIEYIIQKCTELGVYEIIPVEMKRCVVKLNEKDKIKKIDRWQKIAEVAAKQCMRNDILKVEQIISFNQVCDNIKKYDYAIMAYEKEEHVYLKDILKKIDDANCNIAFIIGPEGGIDEQEVEELLENGACSVSLGKRILRTETAPVAISAIVMYELEKGCD